MVRIISLVAVLTLLALSWLYWQQIRSTPLIVSGFVEADRIRVGSRVGGRIREVCVREGDRVRQGTPLFRLEPFDLEEQSKQAEAEQQAAAAELARLRAGFRPEEIAQAQAQRDQLSARRDKLRAGPRPLELEVARETVKTFSATLALARAEFQRAESLARQQAGTKEDLDRAQRALDAAVSELARATYELQLLEEGTRPEEIAEAESALAEAEAQLALRHAGYRREEIDQAVAQVAAAEAKVSATRRALDELTVQAPSDCVVETIDLLPGDLVPANAPSAALLDRSRLRVKAFVPEVHLGRIALGAQVPIRLDSLPERPVTGTITYIATEGEFTPRNIQTPEERSQQVFRIEVTLATNDLAIRAGMIGDVLLDEVVR